MGKKNKKHTELIKQAEHYKRLQRNYEIDLGALKRSLSEYYFPCNCSLDDNFYSLRTALFDTRSLLKMCAEKLREIKNQIKKCNREFETN